jgi:hypothetical protein
MTATARKTATPAPTVKQDKIHAEAETAANAHGSFDVTPEVPADVPAADVATLEKGTEENTEAAKEPTTAEIVATLRREHPEATDERKAEIVALLDKLGYALVPDMFETVAAAVPVEYTRNAPVTFDPNTIAPRIRADLEKSFAGYKPARNSAGEELVGKTGENMWMTQRFPSSTMLLAYVKQARKYAAFKEWTFRGGPVDANKLDDAKVLRFCAKPKEIRAGK